MDVLSEIAKGLLSGEESAVGKLTRQAIDQGLPAKRILEEGLIAGMNVVGQRFRCHEIYLPEVLLAAQAMYAGLDLLRPLLAKAGVPLLGTVVLGSVQGDLHDIGKNLVGIMLKGAGYEVVDLGNDVAPERFVEAAEKHQATVIGMSALLTTTMPGMKTVVDLVKQSALAHRVRTIIGGAPVSEEYARQIGADAYGYDAANAVERVHRLMRAG